MKLGTDNTYLDRASQAASKRWHFTRNQPEEMPWRVSVTGHWYVFLNMYCKASLGKTLSFFLMPMMPHVMGHNAVFQWGFTPMPGYSILFAKRNWPFESGPGGRTTPVIFLLGIPTLGFYLKSLRSPKFRGSKYVEIISAQCHKGPPWFEHGHSWGLFQWHAYPRQGLCLVLCKQRLTCLIWAMVQNQSKIYWLVIWLCLKIGYLHQHLIP